MEMNDVKGPGEVILHQTEDGQTQPDVKLENETAWLTQAPNVRIIPERQNYDIQDINNTILMPSIHLTATIARRSRLSGRQGRSVSMRLSTAQCLKFGNRPSA